MKVFLRHIITNPFIFATGAAALIHSTWSLGTIMSGIEPAPQFSAAWFAWVIPALLIAFSLDVGQIITSAEIRDGERTPTKFATFVILAIATYYLQWVFVAAHIPQIEPGAGVHAPVAAQFMLDLGVWIVPALLPLSTLLYTFSQHRREPIYEPVATMEIATIEQQANADHPEQALTIEKVPQAFTLVCTHCGQAFTKDNLRSAQQALRGHGRQCRLAAIPVSSNGVNHE